MAKDMICMRVPPVLKKQLEDLANVNYRSVAKQILFMINKYIDDAIQEKEE